MAPVTSTRVIFNEYPTGYPEPGKTVIIDKSKTIDLDGEPLNGGVLLKVLVLSIDSLLRGMMNKRFTYTVPFKSGEPFGVSKVLRSDHPKLSAEDRILGFFTTFVEHAVLSNLDGFTKLEKTEGLPWSAYLGVCGMPGQTGHYGYKEHIQPHVKKGDTIFITTGAGQVRSLVIQLAKLDGRSISHRFRWIGRESQVYERLRRYVTLNYKTTDNKEVLKDYSPIDFHWDNVGGDSLDCGLEAAAPFAYFVICTISHKSF